MKVTAKVGIQYVTYKCDFCGGRWEVEGYNHNGCFTPMSVESEDCPYCMGEDEEEG